MSDANPILVEATRGPTVESFHRGALVVLDADGAVVASVGDVERPVFPRSAVKLLQALPLVATGAADRFGLGDDELALACASHGGEAVHTAAAASMLRKAGLDAQVLECGVHPPLAASSAEALVRAGQAPGPLHHNCSGKHAGFVCVGCLLAGVTGEPARAPLRGYVEPGHAVMREVDAALQTSTGANLAAQPVGTDGCSIPTHALTLRQVARGFARAGTGIGLPPALAAAAARLRGAIARHPMLVAGTGRFDTEVMARLGERVCCKVGAEGVYAATFPALGLGLALKMDDGNTARAAEVVMAALIAALLPMSTDDQVAIGARADAPILSMRGREVGRLRAAPTLRQAIGWNA